VSHPRNACQTGASAGYLVSLLNGRIDCFPPDVGMAFVSVRTSVWGHCWEASMRRVLKAYYLLLFSFAARKDRTSAHPEWIRTHNQRRSTGSPEFGFARQGGAESEVVVESIARATPAWQMSPPCRRRNLGSTIATIDVRPGFINYHLAHSIDKVSPMKTRQAPEERRLRFRAGWFATVAIASGGLWLACHLASNGHAVVAPQMQLIQAAATTWHLRT
jgi:hypothetical protein